MVSSPIKENNYKHPHTSLDNMNTHSTTTTSKSMEGPLKQWKENKNGLEEKFNERFDNF